MNVVREVKSIEVPELPVVETVAEALALKAHKANGGFGSDRGQGDAANSLNEAFFVTHLRGIKKGKTTLSEEIASLRKTFATPGGKSDAYLPLERAIQRVKAFRPKNRAFTR